MDFKLQSESFARYRSSTENASSTTRALAISLIGVNWLFATSTERLALNSPLLAISLTLGMLFLAIDAAQYIDASRSYQRLSIALSDLLPRVTSLRTPLSVKTETQRYLATTGFTWRTLELANALSPDLQGDSTKATRRLLELVEEAIYDQSPTDEALRVKDLLGVAWTPPKVASRQRWLFWAKMICLGISVAAFLASVVFATYP